MMLLKRSLFLFIHSLLSREKTLTDYLSYTVSKILLNISMQILPIFIFSQNLQSIQNTA